MSLRIESIPTPDYERVAYAEDSDSGLKSIISVHNLNRGPACGGIRLLPYSTKEEALTDVLRLSKGMSYKSALAQIGFGGGKSVIIAKPEQKTPKLLKAFAQFVNTFEGRYICAKDMNIESRDLKEIKQHTRHVLGIDGEPNSGGDPSPLTAHGVFRGMEAAWEVVSGTRSLRGVHVALQGIGYVGYRLAEKIVAAGGRVTVADVDEKSVKKAVKELGAQSCSTTDILSVACDILSPCARGAILNATTIPQLHCKAVVGCANNQLATPEDGWAIHRRQIAYAPDYAVNSGGIINVFVEFEGYRAERATAMADGIYGTIREILSRSKTSGEPTFLVADRMAEERLRNIH